MMIDFATLAFFRSTPVLSLLLALAAGVAACDGEDGDDDDASIDDDDAAGDDDDTPGDDDDAPGDDDDAPGDDDDGGQTLGECRIAGAGQWADNRYVGYVDYILLADMGVGDELCRMRFDVTTVGDPAQPCDFCYWSTVVQLSNPTAIVDVDNRCADSDRGLTEAEIARLTAAETGMGFAEEATGHGQILVHYDPTTSTWPASAFGIWDADTGELTYDKVEGFCFY
ncbi:MAG: hypothetical protein B7733_24430 [Myxococcales bacterium FL481]|nr:MAG: hypothetical protein B7733_24430 [Myxococcales bacterium FL481]